MTAAISRVDIILPRKLDCLREPARYIVLYGGRAGTKSWGVARRFIELSRGEAALFLCARELQVSIADSVYALLRGQIRALGVEGEYRFTQSEIIHKYSGSKFIFKGIRHNIEEIKSLEGVKYCWIEEAAKLTQRSIDVLFPTIRAGGSQIFITYNPELDADPVHQMFVVNPAPPESIVRKITWRDNPWFPEELDKQRRWLQERDPDTYMWVWEGETRRITENPIYPQATVEPFESPDPDAVVGGRRQRFFFGLDWGFGSDPCAGVRCFVLENTLYIDHEYYAFGAKLEELAPAITEALPGIEKHKAYGDSALPAVIGYIKRNSRIDLHPCTKKQGSIADGITFLQSFDRIVVHPRCENTAREIKLYAYKPKTVKTLQDEEVVHVEPFGIHDHAMDAIRYAFDAEIYGKGRVEVTDEFLKNYQASAAIKGRRINARIGGMR